MDHEELLRLQEGFEERMKVKREQEAKDEADKTEKLRQDYMKRSGRTEMKP